MIALANDNKVLSDLVTNQKNKNYNLADVGSLTKYLGDDVKAKSNGGFELTQSFLIQRIIDLLGLEGNSKHNTKPTPSVKPLLRKNEKGESRKMNGTIDRQLGC